MKKSLIPFFSVPAAFAALAVSAFAEVPVIPRVAKEQSPEDFVKAAQSSRVVAVSARSEIVAPAELENERNFLKVVLKKRVPAKGKNSPGGTGKITLALSGKLPAEGYRMKISSSGVRIEGGSAAGVFYGVQSLNQMLFAVAAAGAPGALPAVAIEDAPLCSWRGVHVDSARHFQPKEWIMKFIDVLSLYKINRLHWHLVDSEGWRLEIKKYPKLAKLCDEYPAYYDCEDPTNKAARATFKYGYFHGGGHYTQEDVKEIVAYAKARHVEIMPEIEFPAHAMAALTAYPEFNTSGKVPSVRSNHSPDLILPNDKGLGFLKDILNETMDLFPFGFIHFGGDEAPKGHWKESPIAQAKIRELGLDKHGDKAENALQAWMFNEMAAHVAKRGKRPVGWEEIMHDDNMEHLTKKAVIMPWLSLGNAVKSANAGHGVIHVSTAPFYLDSQQSDSPADNWPLYDGTAFRLPNIYNFNLFPGNLTAEGRKNILGAQCQLWAELLPKPEHVEFQAFPRVLALAELTWTPQERKNYDDFYRRLIPQAKLLDAHKINYRHIDPLPSGTWNADALSSKTFEIPVEPARLKAADETGLVAAFRHTKGAPLKLRKVELLRGGKVVAADEHDDVADEKTPGGVAFRLPLETTPVPAGKYALRVTHANASGERESAGEVRVFSGRRGTALFDPRNFRGGDYPSALWNKTQTKGGKADVRFSTEGLLTAPGDYELVFTAKNPEEEILVSRLRVAGAKNETPVSKAVAKISAQNPTGIVPVKIDAKALRGGNALVATVESKKPSQGEIRVRRAEAFPKKGGKFAWNADVLSKGAVLYARDVSVKSAGRLRATFRYTGGGNGADILSVQALSAGTVVAEDSHKGFAGGNPKDNVFTLESSALKPGAKIDLRVTMAGAGGTNSEGEITVE